MSSTSGHLPLLLTMGEPAGIGPELAILAWVLRNQYRIPPFAYVGDAEDLAIRARIIGQTIPLRHTTIGNVNEHFAEALPILHQPLTIASTPGNPDPQNAQAIISAVDQAVSLIARGQAGGLITNPIQKNILTETGFPFAGNTEYLGTLAQRYFAKNAHPVMMMVCRELRIALITTHIPLHQVSRMLTIDLIVRIGHIVAHDLRHRFRILHPRIAICGLNPHAGETGTIGQEETDIIAPAINALRSAGIQVTDPLPADTLFHQSARSGYDAVLAMYHDQGLIPIKTIAFNEVVNVSLGLPFVRTSPGHGTACNIAAIGTACPNSLIEAILLAAKLSDEDRRT